MKTGFYLFQVDLKTFNCLFPMSCVHPKLWVSLDEKSQHVLSQFWIFFLHTEMEQSYG